MTNVNGLLNTIDENGNVNRVYPETKIECVEGLSDYLRGKVDKESGKGLSTEDYTSSEKQKLSGIEAQANKTIVDSAFSSTSTNPVQNKVINAAINAKQDTLNSAQVVAVNSGINSSKVEDIALNKANVASLTNRVTQAEEDIAIQTSRIDTIVALPSGSTQGDAELIDIRVKADGSIASSAGNSVREQVQSAELKIKLNQERSLKSTSVNLVDYNTYFKKDGILISTGGEVSDFESWSTVLVPIIGGSTVIIQPANVYYSFYSDIIDVPSLVDGQIISSFIENDTSSSPYKIVSVPVNARYMAICTDTVKFTQYKNVQIAYSSTVIPVTPYVSANEKIDGLYSDITVLSDNVTGLDEKIKNKLDAKEGKNIFNKNSTNKLEGYYFNYTSGGANVNNDFTSFLLPVKSGEKLSFNGVFSNSHVTFYSEYSEDINDFKNLSEEYYITGFANNGSQTGYNIPSNAVAMIISLPNDPAYFIDQAQVEYGNDSTSYERYVRGIELENVIGYNALWVGANQKYKTITEAVSAADNNDVIIVTPGIYHESVKNDFKFLTIIGTSKDECILEYENGDYANPPIEMSKGVIKNLTIHGIEQEKQSGAVAKAYCLHADFDPEANSSLYIENVKFINDDYQVVGIGLRANYNLEFVNCEFICKGNSNAFYCHDWPSGSGINQNVIVKNCTMINNGSVPTILLQSQEVKNSVAICTFKRNIVKNKGSNNLIAMALYNPSIGGGNFLDSTDWHLSDDSALNTLATINA